MTGYKFLLIALMAIVSVSSMYSKNDYSLEGSVKNYKGEPLPSVRVFINHLKKQDFTNTDGIYKINDIPNGSLTVSFARIGYEKIDTIITFSGKNQKIDIILGESDFISDDIVVTGTRSYKYIENLPIPTEVVSKSDIQLQGYIRLDEVLLQQVGLPLMDNHGRGVQMQGLDASYSLILLNGEPITSRMGGIMDISRLSISNVSRVEVVRGPSSSLYGSNALAGVINLITEKPSKPWSFRTFSRYGTFNSFDFAGEIQHASKDKSFAFVLFADRYSTDGFSIVPGSVAKTIPKNNNLTLNGEIFYDIAQNLTMKSDIRNCNEFQDDKYVTGKGDEKYHEVTNNETNFNININHVLSNRYSHEFRFYASRFKTETTDLDYDTRKPFDHYLFQQRTLKGEFQSTALLGENQIIGGLGYKNDLGESTSIRNGLDKMNLLYSYLQDDWQILNNVNLISSLRLDVHSDYGSNLSPKVAASYTPFTGLTFRASAGTGFKAPDFEQLYLEWDNNLEGYSVFGTKYITEGFKKLAENGQIADTLVFPNNIKNLVPEKSIAFDFGFNYSYEELGELKLNIFRNNISNLIDFLPVALKTNGMRLHTYRNINKVNTQGLEARIHINITSEFAFEMNYQYLLAVDELVQDTISHIWKNDAQHPYGRPVRADEYGGLMDRSKHSGAIRLLYDNKDLDLNASLRGTIKGRYGYKDKNGNMILDDDSEYAPGYAIWNFTLTKGLFKYFRLQAGMNNIFDYKNLTVLSINPGRTFFGSIIINYFIY